MRCWLVLPRQLAPSVTYRGMARDLHRVTCQGIVQDFGRMAVEQCPSTRTPCVPAAVVSRRQAHSNVLRHGYSVSPIHRRPIARWHSGTTQSTTGRPTIVPSPASSSARKTTTNFQIRRAGKSTGQAKSLVVLFGFYRATEKAIEKYCDVYHAYNIDVVYVESFFKHFAWPKNSMQLSENLLAFLLSEECSAYSDLLIHAFSMGAFNFTICFDNMYANPERYGQVQQKIRGIVYDSLTIGGLTNMVNGLVIGMSGNALTKTILSSIIWGYFGMTKKHTVDIFDHLVALFKEKPLQVPTMFFYNKGDPMARYEAIEEMLGDWKTRFDFPMTEVCWEKSKHAAHLMVHREEYLTRLEAFLRNIPEIADGMGEKTDQTMVKSGDKPLRSKL